MEDKQAASQKLRVSLHKVESVGQSAAASPKMRRASFESALGNCPKAAVESPPLYPRDSDMLPPSVLRRASLPTGASLKTTSRDLSFAKGEAYQKLQSQWVRSALRDSQNTVEGQAQALAAPKTMPLFMMDGKFANRARASNMAAALTVRALMIKGVSRAHIANSGLSLKANRVNWDCLEVDGQGPPDENLPLFCEQKLDAVQLDAVMQKRITMRRQSQAALIVRLRSLEPLELESKDSL